MTINKVCACGEKFVKLPEDAKFYDQSFGIMSGYYFNCPECKSTHVVKALTATQTSKIKEIIDSLV